MAVTIDELQVETQEPAPQTNVSAAGSSTGSSKSDTKAEIRKEIEHMRERELRLRAD
jgi:hypothetical protein